MSTTWNKPAGVPVFPPHDDPDGDCALRQLLAAHPDRADQDWPRGFAGGIAHRLDTSTSGALLVADTPGELTALRAAFASGTLTKTYLMRAARDVSWHEHVVDRPIAHDAHKRKKMIVQRGEQTPHRGSWYPAHTTLTRVQGDLWRVGITTGVMHQIRIHAAFVGLPLLGDALYGGGPTPADAPPGVTFFLHHVGLTGPDLQTTPVEAPDWTQPRSTITGA